MTTRRIVMVLSIALGLAIFPFVTLSYYSLGEFALQAYGQRGSIGGTVVADSSPQAGVQVVAYRQIGNELIYAGDALTNQQGTYRINQLSAPNTYFVWFISNSDAFTNEWYNNANSTQTATTVNVTANTVTTNINATLDSSVAALAEVTSNTGSVSTDSRTGQISILMPSGRSSSITINRQVTCPAGDPTSVVLRLVTSSSSQNYTMSQVGTSNTYEATIPQGDVKSATLNIVVTCSDGTSDDDIGRIFLYDPSGIISDNVTGEPVEGAQVELYEVPGWTPKTSANDTTPNTCHTVTTRPGGENGDWSALPPARELDDTLGVLAETESGRIDPATNPQNTNAEGRYGWDVAGGCWYVVVEANGYASQVSPVVGVPPEVTDLDLSLTPLVTPSDNTTVYLPFVER